MKRLLVYLLAILAAVLVTRFVTIPMGWLVAALAICAVFLVASAEVRLVRRRSRPRASAMGLRALQDEPSDEEPAARD